LINLDSEFFNRSAGHDAVTSCASQFHLHGVTNAARRTNRTCIRQFRRWPCAGAKCAGDSARYRRTVICRVRCPQRI